MDQDKREIVIGKGDQCQSKIVYIIMSFAPGCKAPAAPIHPQFYSPGVPAL